MKDKPSKALYLKSFVDDKIGAGNSIDTDAVSTELSEKLKKEFTDEEFEKLIMVSGWIPDLYENDSAEETLYSKLIEVLVSEWARRIGCCSEYIKIKSDHEDVKITIGESIIVCDAKSFRLSRSQKAPNPKDMVKPDAFKEWSSRHEKSVGGLVTYPSTHDWVRGSVVYRDCSNKDNPILMLSYKHMALLLHHKGKYQVNELLKLWDYNALFPSALNNNSKNKSEYWSVINNFLKEMLSITSEEMNSYMADCDDEIKRGIKEYRAIIETAKKEKIAQIKKEVENEDTDTLRLKVIDWRIENEASDYDVFMNRIDSFR